MKTFKIKMEDKAAFINRIGKLGVSVATNNIKDDLVTNSFMVQTDDPEEIRVIKSVLKSSPKINDLKETIKNIIKEEIQKRLEM
jgi:hypothetical protein